MIDVRTHIMPEMAARSSFFAAQRSSHPNCAEFCKRLNEVIDELVTK
jgi:hypothetical protein